MTVELPKIFEGATVTIVGGGPSLEGFDFGGSSHPIFAINNSIYFIDSPDLFLALDQRFHTRHRERISELECAKLSREQIHFDLEDPVDVDLSRANLSGLTAIQVALTLGAAKLLLLGFDGGYDAEKSNYYENDMSYLMSWRYEMQNELFSHFQNQDIINIGLNSKIEVFHKVKQLNY